MVDKSLSLEQLEGHAWSTPPADATRLARTAHALRRLLELDPLTEGDFYPGDLLVAVLEVPPAHWHPSERRRASSLVAKLDNDPGTPEYVQREIDAFR
ncbi:contact-dependent growth inhibition system immunity protein [Amycolatopsis eburnea]|uniref:Uncharacterized protein n=1 Tax=Amycolatopsis eburnea TaxID=2267691 RepID=A0A427TFA3_9PSEU|nr:contact-dependent growth inhibition system immunity protein [Amycolatopsis eburnea]RSD21755.1 hypothetical protein EIY87_07925 [Amycolatopsis eburnea]